MSKIIQVERSIHYSMHDYHGKADFEKLTPMFLGYKIKHKLGLTGPFKRFNYVIHFLKKGNDIFIESGTQHLRQRPLRRRKQAAPQGMQRPFWKRKRDMPFWPFPTAWGRGRKRPGKAVPPLNCWSSLQKPAFHGSFL